MLNLFYSKLVSKPAVINCEAMLAHGLNSLPVFAYYFLKRKIVDGCMQPWFGWLHPGQIIQFIVA